ncbi:MAG: hypothetical protein IPL78_21170 [Chloroflexi bacterium]|nr:hypothetical protein [Chloroflexota bacterium]
MTYPGGKGRTYQHIINHLPPHDVYIAAFLGEERYAILSAFQDAGLLP